MATHKLAPGSAPWRAPRSVHPSPAALRCRAKFLRFFPEGFQDGLYLDRERGSNRTAHEQWEAALGGAAFRSLLADKRYADIADLALKAESRTNLLAPFEKTALRDAVRTPMAAEAFATSLYGFLQGDLEREAFEHWTQAVAVLPHKQTRVFTWPLVTAFGFIARPDRHIYLKPSITKIGARLYGFDFRYASQPNWDTYASLLDFAATVWQDLRDLEPRDMIDVQSFMRVQGSDEYQE